MHLNTWFRYTLEAAGITVPMNIQIIKPENANNFKEFKNTAGVIDQVRHGEGKRKKGNA